MLNEPIGGRVHSRLAKQTSLDQQPYSNVVFKTLLLEEQNKKALRTCRCPETTTKSNNQPAQIKREIKLTQAGESTVT